MSFSSDTSIDLVIESFLGTQHLYAGNNRSILIQWLYEVLESGLVCKVAPYTHVIQMTMNYIDRYAMINEVDYAQIQLLGITSMWIALKISDTKPESVSVMSPFCGTDPDGAQTYTADEVLTMEVKIGKALYWNFMKSKSMFELCIIVSKQLSPQLYNLFSDPDFLTALIFFNDVVMFQPAFASWDSTDIAFTIMLLMSEFWNKKMIAENRDIIYGFNYTSFEDRVINVASIDDLIQMEIQVCDGRFIRNKQLIPILLKGIWSQRNPGDL